MFGSKILPIDSIIVGVVCNFAVFYIMNMRSKPAAVGSEAVA